MQKSQECTKRRRKSGTVKDVETRRVRLAFGVSLAFNTSTYGFSSGIFCSRAYGGDIMCSFVCDFLYPVDDRRIDAHRLALQCRKSL
jgi:hypothetical protein